MCPQINIISLNKSKTPSMCGNIATMPFSLHSGGHFDFMQISKNAQGCQGGTHQNFEWDILVNPFQQKNLSQTQLYT